MVELKVAYFIGVAFFAKKLNKFLNTTSSLKERFLLVCFFSKNMPRTKNDYSILINFFKLLQPRKYIFCSSCGN